MLRVYRICLDNHITLCDLSVVLGVRYNYVGAMLKMKADFSLNYLYKVRDFLVQKNLIKKDIDIGSLLDILPLKNEKGLSKKKARVSKANV